MEKITKKQRRGKRKNYFKVSTIAKNPFLISILIGILLIPLILAAVNETYESYMTGADNWLQVQGATWRTQTFTIGNTGTDEDFKLTRIGIKAYRSGTPGVCVAVIRATLAGDPTGANLSTGKFDADTFTATGNPGAWQNITMNSTLLSASTKYALMLSCPSSIGGEDIQWMVDQTSPSYTGGSYGTSSDSGSTWTMETAIDTMFIIYGNVTSATASSINVSLFEPVNQASIGDSAINFTANVSVESFTLKNSTFTVWYTNGTLFNQTTEAMASSNNTERNITGFVVGTYDWNVRVCGENATATQCNWASTNFTFDIGVKVLNYQFPGNVSETERATFLLNISLLSGANLFAARLNYNGTRYLATKKLADTNVYTLSRSLDIPLLKYVYRQNISFFWEFEYKNGFEGNQNSTTYSHIVNPLKFQKCNASQSITFWNITFANETSRKTITSILDGSFDYWLGTGTVKKNYTLDGTQVENNYTFCSNKKNLNVSSIINIKSASFFERTFYFNKQLLNSTITHTKLFLQEAGESIIVEVTNPGLIAQVGIFVNVYRFYPDINDYRIVEKAKTDEFGQFVARLIEPNTIKYQFEFLNSENEILKRTDDITIACRTTICVIPFVIEDSVDDFNRFNNVTDFDYTLSYSNTTNIFTYSWNDVTGSSITSRLLVERIAFNGTTTICNSTSTSSASSLTCDVGSSRAKYRSQVFRKESGEDEQRIALLNIEVGSIASIFGLEGLFWSFILLFTLVGVGSFNPSVGIGLYTIGFIALGVIGVISVSIPIFFANILLGILFIWSIRT